MNVEDKFTCGAAGGPWQVRIIFEGNKKFEKIPSGVLAAALVNFCVQTGRDVQELADALVASDASSRWVPGSVKEKN